MKLKKIYFFLSNQGKASFLNEYAKSLASALEKKGIRCRLFDTNQDSIDKLIKIIVNEPPECFISFNFTWPNKEGKFLCDFLNTPHMCYLVDLPLDPMFKYHSPYMFFSCVDLDGCQFLESRGFHPVLNLPYGIDAAQSISPSKERPYECVLMDVGHDLELLKARLVSKYSADVIEMLDEAAEAILESPSLSLFDEMDEMWLEYKLHQESYDWIEFSRIIELMVQSKNAKKMIEMTRDFSVHVFLDPQNPLNPDFEKETHVTVHDKGDATEIKQVFAQSKVILDNSVQLKKGSHAHLLLALSAGASVLSYHTQFITENFSSNEGVVTYRAENDDGQWYENIKSLIASEEKRVQAVEKGQKKILEAETWDHRAKELLETLPNIVGRIFAEQEG